MNTSSDKILIVEDDALLSFVEEKLAIYLGYTVVGKASNSEEALEKIKELSPDILIMDVHLKGSMNGIEIVELLRSHHDNIPVVFLSGTSDESIIKRAKNLKYVEYLLKPFDASVLKGPLKKASNSVLAQGNHAA